MSVSLQEHGEWLKTQVKFREQLEANGDLPDDFLVVHCGCGRIYPCGPNCPPSDIDVETGKRKSMSAAIAKVEHRVGIELPAIRRFEMGDLSTYAPWLLPRLVTALELPEQRIAGWLRCMIDSQEHLMLVQPHSAALAELQMANGLASKPVVRERFVMAQDINDPEHIKEAAGFYDEFKRWAKNLGAEILIVEELSNVPDEMIKAKLGRIMTRQEQFVRV